MVTGKCTTFDLNSRTTGISYLRRSLRAIGDGYPSHAFVLAAGEVGNLGVMRTLASKDVLYIKKWMTYDIECKIPDVHREYLVDESFVTAKIQSVSLSVVTTTVLYELML